MSDIHFMQQALAFAERGLFSTDPNPRVGCVIVKDNKVISFGWHEKAGESHAEIHALNRVGSAANGSTVYVTLEPCTHYGRTPPCAQELVKSGVRRVVIAMLDPNPMNHGKGVTYLRDSGIEVEVGVLESEARALNIGFVHRMETSLPWVRAKIAASLDGRSALSNGKSQWITSDHAREDGHHWRARSTAMMTGVGTILADNPTLTARPVESDRPLEQPFLVIVDTHLRTPIDAKVFSATRPVVIATASTDKTALNAWEKRGVHCVTFAPSSDGQVDLPALIRWLGDQEVNELHVESGPGLSGALIEQKCVNELLVYLAPCLLGGDAKPFVQLPLIKDLKKKIALSFSEIVSIGPDIRIRAKVE